MEEGDPHPWGVWYLPNPGICLRQAGVSRAPPPSHHFIPGISGWFVGLTLLCRWPRSRFEFSFVLLKKSGAWGTPGLGLSLGVSR